MKPTICLSYCFHVAFLFYGVVITFTTTPIVFASGSGNETDHQALLSFKKMITQDPYGALSSWNHSFHLCDWNGVSCGKRHKRVTRVVFVSQGLVGSLSPQLGNLSFLRELWLGNNSFQGSIPHEFGRLSRLRVISLHHNKLNGVIPTNLSNCSKLEQLEIAYNKLVGSIPKEISSLSKLVWFSVENNSLTGGMPPFLGNLTSMEVVYASFNPLGGIIPDTLGYLKSLRKISCGDCNLHGTIPHSIYNLSLLTDFSFSLNELTGSFLPSAIGAKFPRLVNLQLGYNQLSGPIPPSISNCSKLRNLQLQSNNFRGKLAIDFANLRDIHSISLHHNDFYAHRKADEMKFIDSLKNCSTVHELELSNCNFQGTLPMSIGNLSDQLSYLSLQENKLHGNVPSSIGNLVGLTTLVLGYNQFTGNIPSTIGKLQMLQDAHLNSNQFSGSIPDTIGNLSMLLMLLLDSNRLEGRIPSSLGNCHSLSILYLSNNKLSGKIPIQILQLPSLSILLALNNNSLSGSLPEEVGDLKMLNYLNLHDNNLSGNIPNSLGACVSLVFLSLKGNLFQGMIPQSLSSLKGLATLDLSHNNLSGQIPHFLEHFLLDVLVLSYNDFEGEVPMIGVFANSSAFSVVGNKRLCGGLIELGLPKCKDTKKHKKKKFPLFIIIIISVLISFTLFTTLCFVWYKKKSKGQPSQSSGNTRFLQVSYNELLKATNGFSETNLIGQGGFSSLYKGILDGDDKFVAIKVVHLRTRGAQKSFMRECEAWRNIRHRNILKIITSCSSIDFQGNDFKALVYEFMPNGSLNDWLHSSAHASRLNLIQRINILIDVATALDYLHNHCSKTIVHGDVKPSNILLDDDMVAHVGDFGLARFLRTNSNENSTTGVIGTIGYAPPEYGLGSKMTSSGDVYSFGILLLEVMTGRNPTDGIFNEELSLHKFADMALPDHVTDITDVSLLNYHPDDTIGVEENAKKMEGCLASAMKIGVSCSMDSPSQRMIIENAVHELQHILDMIQNI